MHQNQNKNKQHVPVLLSEVLTYLNPKEGDSYLDLTAGYGGHASAVLEKTHAPGDAVLVDRDKNPIDELQNLFGSSGTSMMHEDFLTASRKLIKAGRTFDCILADLGVSSPHLDMASRGFSLKTNGPLDMRMDQRQELTAGQVVNTYSEDDLVAILHEFGEEPKARAIARTIIANRPIQTTTELANLVAKAWRGKSIVHPATRTFQALRIAVNAELVLLKEALPFWIQLLAPGGRLAVISFHSLEDRLVKQAFADASGNRYDAELKLLTHGPVSATSAEIVSNPRARSAKLRAACKIKTKTGAKKALGERGLS